jgi:threonine/homoserine/homoserine lactone efflux protein
MFGTVHLEVFLLSGILLNITPGADTIYILSRSIAQGRQAGIYSVLGISAGIAVHTLLAALGLSLILSQSALAFSLVKIAGALYLGYLGFNALVQKGQTLISLSENKMNRKSIFLQGLLTNVLNPKVALFFLSFLPQFVDPGNHFGILPFIFLGCVFLTTGTLWCMMLVLFSSGMTSFLRENQKVSTVLNKACGVVYLLLGIKILTIER